MGYLTTFTIYNDGCDQILKYPKEFAEKIHTACCNTSKAYEFGLGYHSNLVECQKARHADDKTVYVHAGNGLFEMNPYSKETESLMVNSPKFFEEMLSEMESRLKELKKQFKEKQL
jgi:hypothetical protein